MKKVFVFGSLIFCLLLVGVFAQNAFVVAPSDSIKQRALDISKQIELYLDANSDMTLEDLRNNEEFQDLAVQSVGNTGYTYLIVKETGILEFHPDPDIRDGSYDNFKEEFPVIWGIIDETIQSEGCVDSSGFYGWRDLEDHVREKYTYHHCIDVKTADGYTLFIGASTYLDEYGELIGEDNYLFYFLIAAVLIIFILLFILLFKFWKGEGEKASVEDVVFGKINRKFMFILVTVFLILFTIGVLIVYFQNQVLDEQALKNIKEVQKDFSDLEKNSVRALSAALEVVLQDEGMKQVYLEKDRKKLFDYGQPLFQSLKDKYAITHFYFIEPNGVNFVRLHNEKVFGDKIERITFLEAQRTGEIASGIELGKTAYALRVVSPYYDNGELIGYVELGQEIDQFLDMIKGGGNQDFSILVKKSLLDEKDWAEYSYNKGIENSWDDLEGYVVVDATSEETLSCFSSENVNFILEDVALIDYADFNKEVFACGGFPLIDASGEKSGVIFSFSDVVREHEIMGDIRNVFFGVLFVFVFLLALIGFYVVKRISRPIAELNLVAEEIGKKNFKTRVNIKTGDELEVLGNTFNSTAKVLENMDKEYRQLEKAKTEFLSITSHELRSPMTPMQAQLQMLLKEYYGKITVKQKQALNIVARNTKRLDNIIVDFLEISRIEAARLKFRFAKGDPSKCVKQVAKEMVGFMPEKKVKVATKIGKLPVIEYDSSRLSQVIRNLANNAIKFSKIGGRVVISAELKRGFILFSVKDQGIGIGAEDQRRIFEPFFQAEQTIYREHQGTGLGLAIVKGIVESQNGKVWIESKEKVGTTFYFTLPLKPVRKVKPIKLLFSDAKDKKKKIKTVFVDLLGPMGSQEFENLERKNQLNKKDLVWYVDILVKKRILSEENGEVFKGKILRIFGEKKLPANTEDSVKKFFVKKEDKREKWPI
ncbi:HAMP domain-containing protein [Methanococcoides sp. SA1]|nr:HAMP domain-containing protein [Methanococcoides sp. SA1]